MVIIGNVFPINLKVPPTNVSNFFVKVPTINAGGSFFSTIVSTSNPVVQNQPLAPNNNAIDGTFMFSYNELFYNRILIEPILVNVGNLVSNQFRTVNVFNAYFITKTLEGITAYDNDGVDLDGDVPPVSYLPLVEKQYQLSIQIEGPPGIDASFVFDFDGTEDDITVRVIGSRIVLFPYLVRPGMKEVLQWKTSVLTSYDGSEQRIRVRKSPRQILQVISYAGVNERNRIDNLFYGWRKQLWAVPIWSEQRVVTQAVAKDSTLILVDTSYGDFRQLGLGIIWESDRKFDVFEIETFTDISITASREINDNYSASAVVAPVRISKLVSNPRRVSSGYDGIAQAIFQVTDNTDIPADASLTQYDNMDVLLDPPDSPGEAFTDQYNMRIDTLDFETGPINFSSPWIYTKPSRVIRYTLEGLEDIWNFRRWLHRRAGQLVPFWMPTFENNLRLISTGNITSQMTVKNDEYQSQGAARDHIAVFDYSGNVYIRQTLSVELDTNGDTSLVMDSALNIDASTVDFISFCGVKRLNSDNISLTWQANNVAVVDLPLLEVLP